MLYWLRNRRFTISFGKHVCLKVEETTYSHINRKVRKELKAATLTIKHRLEMNHFLALGSDVGHCGNQ